MKKILLFLFVFGSLTSFAQITLEHAHIMATGRQYTEASDNFKRPIPSSGANQTWDYSALKSNSLDSIRFGMPFWYKGYTNFPTSNYGIINNSDTSSITFATLTPSSLVINGSYSSSDTSLQIFKINMKIFEFPSTYNHQFSESLILPGLSLGVGIDPDSTGPLPKIDSLQISTGINRKATMNGWGSLKTPLGTFNALKQTTLSVTSQLVFANVNGTWIQANQAILNFFNITLPSPDSTYEVQFMTNSGGIGVPLMTCNYRPKDTTASEFKWLYSTPRKSNVSSIYQNNIAVYPNPAQSILNIELPGVHRFEFCNTIGQDLISGTIQDKTILETSEIARGVYFLKIYNSRNELVHTERLLIQ